MGAEALLDRRGFGTYAMKLPRVSRHGLGAFYERNEFADGVVETGGGRHPRQAVPPDETQRTPQKDQDAETV